ncbi:MAG: hypothetical protein AUK63_2601, partial [bacterium P3]
IQNAYGIVRSDKVAQTRRKKQIIVLIVRFKDYLPVFDTLILLDRGYFEVSMGCRADLRPRDFF